MTEVDSHSGKQKKKHGRFFQKVLDKTRGKNEDKGHMEISGPTDFKHESHIGWTPENGFDIKNIPPEWKELFQAAGIKKKDLQNPETVSFIYSVIGQNINEQQMNKAGTGVGGTISTANNAIPQQQVRSRAPPPPPPPGQQQMGSTQRIPPPKPGTEIRQLPKQLPPQPGMSGGKPIAQQQQQQLGNRKVPATINGKPIPIHQNFMKQENEQPINPNEPLIHQEYKSSQYKLDEPLQPTQKRQSPPTTTFEQQPQMQPTISSNNNGVQSYVYNPTPQQSQQYTYQAGVPIQKQQSIQSPTKRQQPTPPSIQRTGRPTPPLPRQQVQSPMNRAPPPIPTSKRPTQQQTTQVQSPKQAIQPPIIQRTLPPQNVTQQQQQPILINKIEQEEQLQQGGDINVPPPPPMPESLAHIPIEKADSNSPLPPPPQPISSTPIAPPISIAAPPPPPPAVTTKPISSIPPAIQSDSSRTNLMDSIRGFGGTSSHALKKVDPNEPLPDLKELQLGESGSRSLVDTLAAAMAQRRGNLGEVDSDDDENDSDWEN